jgi:hypothetical protein
MCSRPSAPVDGYMTQDVKAITSGGLSRFLTPRPVALRRRAGRANRWQHRARLRQTWTRSSSTPRPHGYLSPIRDDRLTAPPDGGSTPRASRCPRPTGNSEGRESSSPYARRAVVDAIVDRWREDCLIHDGSCCTRVSTFGRLRPSRSRMNTSTSTCGRKASSRSRRSSRTRSGESWRWEVPRAGIVTVVGSCSGGAETPGPSAGAAPRRPPPRAPRAALSPAPARGC